MKLLFFVLTIFAVIIIPTSAAEFESGVDEPSEAIINAARDNPSLQKLKEILNALQDTLKLHNINENFPYLHKNGEQSNENAYDFEDGEENEEADENLERGY